jgi:orotidine-5'-phosphate decarboxylase
MSVFADLKLIDIGETLATDGEFLRMAKPEILTAMCFAGEKTLRALKTTLPETEVIGVTVLTSLNDDDTRAMFAAPVVPLVARLTNTAINAGLDGLVASAQEAMILRQLIGDTITINTPGIRPLWHAVSNDDQNPERVMTPKRAMEAGADRIVVGRPITQSNNPYDAVMQTMEEIAAATQ